MRTIVNDAMINRLVEGDAQSVQNFKSLGLSLTWAIDRVVDEDGDPMATEVTGVLSPGQQIERFSLWHWSHRANKADGVVEWWKGMDRELYRLSEAEQAPFLATRLEEAIEASALSGETVPALYTWGRALEQTLPLWERKIMLNQLFNVLERQGNRLSPLLDRLHATQHLTSKDWSPSRQKSYAIDPVSLLYDNRSWDALRIILEAGAAPVHRNGTPLLNQLATQAKLGLTEGNAVDTQALDFIGYMLTQLRGEELSPSLRSDLTAIERSLKNTDYQAALTAHLRAHTSHTQEKVALPASKPRRRS